MNQTNEDVWFPLETITLCLSYVFIFSLPIRRAITVGPVTISRLVGVILFVSWLVLVTQRKETIQITKFHLAFSLLILWAVLSYSWLPNGAASSALVTLTGLFMALGLTIILWDLYDSLEKLMFSFQAYVIGSSVLYFSLIYAFAFGEPAAAGARYTALGFEHLNIVSVLLAVGVPFSVYLIFTSQRENTTIKVINICYIPGAIIGIFLTGSRQGFILLLFGLISLLYYLHHYNRLIHMFYGFLGVAIAILLSPRHNIDRFIGTTGEVRDGDIGGRLERWEATWEVFSITPIRGHGIGGSRFVQESIVGWSFTPHNSYLSLLADLGVVGFLLFALTIIFVFLSIIHSKVHHKLFWLITLGMALTMIIPDDLYTDAVFWFLIVSILIGTKVGKGNYES